MGKKHHVAIIYFAVILAAVCWYAKFTWGGCHVHAKAAAEGSWIPKEQSRTEVMPIKQVAQSSVNDDAKDEGGELTPTQRLIRKLSTEVKILRWRMEVLTWGEEKAIEIAKHIQEMDEQGKISLQYDMPPPPPDTEEFRAISWTNAVLQDIGSMVGMIEGAPEYNFAHLLPVVCLLVDMNGDRILVRDTDGHKELMQMIKDLINWESRMVPMTEEEKQEPDDKFTFRNQTHKWHPMTEEEKAELNQRIMTHKLVKKAIEEGRIPNPSGER
jgi:hypothetical protein